MKRLKIIGLSFALLWSGSLFAFCISNNLEEPIHWRVHGPSTIIYYGKVHPHQQYCKSVNKHIRLYVYFRRAYDILNPFLPIYRDIICPELLRNDVNPNAQITVKENGAFYRCETYAPVELQ